MTKRPRPTLREGETGAAFRAVWDSRGYGVGMTYDRRFREDPVLDGKVADEIGARVARRLAAVVAAATGLVAAAAVLIRRTRTR